MVEIGFTFGRYSFISILICIVIYFSFIIELKFFIEKKIISLFIGLEKFVFDNNYIY